MRVGSISSIYEPGPESFISFSYLQTIDLSGSSIIMKDAEWLSYLQLNRPQCV